MSREDLDDPNDRVALPSRRQALFTARDVALAALATPVLPQLASAADPKPDPATSLCVMHGFIDQQGILLWMQGARAQRLRVEVMAKPGAAPVQTVEAELDPKGDFTATAEIGGLDPGAPYHYAVRDARSRALLARGAFRTQPLWQWRTDPPTVRIATGSCAYINEPRYDRPGKPYGGGYEIFDTIADASPDLMVWLGDTLYLREADYSSRAGVFRRYRYQRSHESLRKLWTACPHVGIWDDHDFGPDDGDASYAGRGWTLDAFRCHWPLPYSTPEDGIYGRILQGDVEIFLLDDRSSRYPNRWPEDADKVLFGAKQIRWLKAALTYSPYTPSPTPPFRIIAGGSQFLNRASGGGRESWAKYPAEQAEFLRWLEERKIPGVFFLSGDRHIAQMLRFERGSLYPLVEITTSPLTASVTSHIDDAELASKDIVPGTILRERNFAMITVTGPREKRELVVEIRNTKGEKRWEWKTTAAEMAQGTRA
jgi:alkaline phosphatase D